MPGTKTNYFEGEVLKWSTGQVNALGPAMNPWLALYTTAPTDAGGGVEVAGGGYQRVNTTGMWAVPFVLGPRTITRNNAIVAFLIATGNWGIINGCAILDAFAGGNMIWWATLTVPVEVKVNYILQFGVNDLVLSDT